MNLSRQNVLLIVVALLCTVSAFAQPGFKVDIEKPKPYEERKLKSEKTGDGKLKGPKLVLQNLTTHFNYYFNANNKVAEVLDRAKAQHKDDYAQLLSFYNYDLAATAADKNELDSVVLKARTALANHDLRNEWTDDLYLLWAQAWHLQQKFDSAALMLQFINYAYAPQQEGYTIPIGTRQDGAQEISIATREDKKLFHNNSFSRNNAFLWQVRNRIEMGDITGAGSLLATLRHDPAFPQRLSTQLDEAAAYWYYRQGIWDSAAVHLLAALDGDYPRLEKARWQYLAAQMMEQAGKNEEAAKLYEKVVAATPDPVMEVYARLNLVHLSKGGEAAVDNNVAELLKMAKKDKYEDYRDIIYYMAAQMEMERNNIAAATDLLLKGSKYNNGNAAARNKAFLQLADALYLQKKYLQAAPFYDSVQVTDLAEADARRVTGRKPALQKLVAGSGVIVRQDSLQRIAALPQEERAAYVKALSKKLRRQLGLKDEAAITAGSAFAGMPGSAPADLFSTQNKGEWYFYNTAVKAQGAAQFKAVWGTRPNVDNWRRMAAVNQQIAGSLGKPMGVPDPNVARVVDTDVAAGNDFTVEGLLGRLPLTPEALKSSNDSIRTALYQLGMTYLNEMEDNPSAISTFEELRRRFPDAAQMDEVLFNLYYAYTKAGNTAEAAQVKRLLSEKYPLNRLTVIATTGKDPLTSNDRAAAATKAYEGVYNLFIEGRFDEAETAKHIADSTYQTNFWQPQLLYIESVYFIRQREDSMAKSVLQTIIRQNSNKALTEKAKTLIDVLSRRKQIEDELTRLQISRPSDNDSVAAQPVAYQQPAAAKDTLAQKPVTAPKDSVAVVKKAEIKPAVDTVALAKAAEKKLRDSVALAKVTEKRLRDSLTVVKRDSLLLARQQAAKASADSIAARSLAAKQKRDSIAGVKAALLQAKKDSLALAKAMRDQSRDSLALQRYQHKRRLDSLAKVTSDSLALVKKQAAQARADSIAAKALATKQRNDSLLLVKAAKEQARKDSMALQKSILKQQQDSLALARQAAKDLASKPVLKLPADTLASKPKNPVGIKKPLATSPEGYVFNPNEAHAAVVVLNKVDPIFVSEAKNAFVRYNKENYYNQELDVQILNLTANQRLLIISGLPTAAAAADYAAKAKTLAPAEIIPWLTGNKYSFSIISAPNLQILQAKTDINAYQAFLEQQMPLKF